LHSSPVSRESDGEIQREENEVMVSDGETGDLFGPRSLQAVTDGIVRRTRRKAREHAPTPIKTRLVESSVQIGAEDPRDIAYQHTTLCQTCLPYRDPGEGVRVWERLNGQTHLKVLAGEAMHPEQGRLVELGLPFGPKPRLILAHLNTEALRSSSPVIELEDSLTAFVRRLRLDPKGRNIHSIKEQLARLAASTVRLGVIRDGRALTVKADIVHAFDLWFPKDERQRVLWPSTVQLSHEYFESLQRHAVPLDERALASLSHSAMGIDLYCWLAQRLHRIKPGNPQFIPWTALQAQFGWQYTRIRKFREVFRQTISVVLTQYRGARLDLDRRGATLHHSPPPVAKRMVLITKG
jgi:hypothetical protein